MTDPATLDEFTVPSEPGGEKEVVRRLTAALEPMPLTRDERDRLGTAVAETVMNAIEHGNHNDPRLDVEITLRTDGASVEVLVADRGGLRALPEHSEIPDLDAKLDGLQSPRGWGLFLVRSMVDEMDVVADPDDPGRQTVRLVLRLSGPLSGPLSSVRVPPAREEPDHAREM